MLPEAPADVPPDLRSVVITAFARFAESRFSVAGRGWDSLAIDIDGRYIAKFPQSDVAKEALRREARLLTAVRRHASLPVPHMQLVERPQLFSLHEKLVGDTLLRADYERLPESARSALADALARFFAELHAIDQQEMREAGAASVECWDTSDATLSQVWPELPVGVREKAHAALDDYAARRWNEEVYGFFDAHGWNMAFDHERQRLTGIFDFADSGFGPAAREFVPVTLISPDLARQAMTAYAGLTGRHIASWDVHLLTAAARLSEFAGALGTGEHVEAMRGLVIDWFTQNEVC